MSDSLHSQLANIRNLFADAAPTDPKMVSNYAWTIVKVILQHCSELGSTTARQLLADCIKLPLQRPSRVYSALLAAAVKVFNTYPDFHFATFLRMWDIANFLVEDKEPQKTQDGRTIPALVSRVAKALGNSLLIHPEDANIPNSSSSEQCTTVVSASASQAVAGYEPFNTLLSFCGFSIHQMLVTRVKQAEGKDGRKYTFVTLTSPEGIEMECISHNLQPFPIHPLPEGKRHYANIGQLYNCLLRTKSASAAVQTNLSTGSCSSTPAPGSISTPESGGHAAEYNLTTAYLSQSKPSEVFPTAIGYIEAIDSAHGHMHVYDNYSRHFVAPVQRFSRERVGDFVCFIPIIPAASKFKTAIILTTVPSSSISATVPSDSSEGLNILREIRITHINKEKGYAAWELVDKEKPITEFLSPLQLSQGETSPSFTTGYLNLTSEGNPQVSESFPLGSISPGQTLQAFIYLKRGKDRQKRPHIARLFGTNEHN